MQDEKASAPGPVPELYRELVAKIEEKAAFQYDRFQIPYAIQAKMAEQRYTKLEDIAERWPDATLRDCAADDLEFKEFKTYTAFDKTYYITRLVHVVKMARIENDNNVEAMKYGSNASAQSPGNYGQAMNGQQQLQKFDKNERLNLMAAWTLRAAEHPKPLLTEIGSPDMVKTMRADMTLGQIPLLDIKKIVPAQAPTDDQPLSKKLWKMNQWGSYVETEETFSRFPLEKKIWIKSLLIWRNTFLALMYTMPEVKEFDITKEDLDAFYAYILGREIAERQPEPPLTTLVHTERNVWKEVNLHLAEGMRLKEALTTMKNKGLFWMQAFGLPGSNHIHPYQREPQGGKPGRQRQRLPKLWKGFNKQQSGGGYNMPPWPKGKGHSKGADGGYYGYNNYNNPQGGGKPGKIKGFGKGNDKGKGKGGKWKGDKGKGGGKMKGDKGKGGGKSWQSHWANKDKQGKEFCRNYHTTGCNMGDNCLRSHMCPKQENGYICMKPHKAGDCTQFA